LKRSKEHTSRTLTERESRAAQGAARRKETAEGQKSKQSGIKPAERNFKMKKKFKIEVDCANCAAKMENAVKNLDGVNDVNVNFMMQKMKIDADDDRFDEIMKEVVKACKKVEPDCEIYL
jgi:copper chaperone CopZ